MNGLGITIVSTPRGVLSDAEAREARTLQAPLIGRDEELATLRSAATRTTTGPDGAIALMLGDAGMGKTRLLDELVAHLGDDMLVLRGSGHSVGARPFGLIADVLEPLIEQMAPGHDKDVAETVRSVLRLSPNCVIPEIPMTRPGREAVVTG